MTWRRPRKTRFSERPKKCIPLRQNAWSLLPSKMECLTKRQCRARTNPPNRFFATRCRCSFVSKCVSKGLLKEPVGASRGGACVRSRSLAESGGFDFAIPDFPESLTRTKENLPYIHIYMARRFRLPESRKRNARESATHFTDLFPLHCIKPSMFQSK